MKLHRPLPTHSAIGQGSRTQSHVYYARRESDGAIKIGRSKDPIRRVRHLATEQGVPVTLLAFTARCNGLIAERLVHEAFAAHRIEGEWFYPAAEIDSTQTAVESHSEDGAVPHPTKLPATTTRESSGGEVHTNSHPGSDDQTPRAVGVPGTDHETKVPANSIPRSSLWPYRAIYEQRRLETIGRDWSDGHKHNDALRIVGKAILADLWVAAQ